MCIFTGNVQHVSKTQIFASRNTLVGHPQHGCQALVYAMEYTAMEETAMVLPLPVHPQERSAHFVSLKQAPDFFERIEEAFPRERTRAPDFLGGMMSLSAPALPVQQVGDYDASLVPTPKDFYRLDLRFQLPQEVWDSLPQYEDFAFAVFKLRSGARRAHPMALWFRHRDPKELWFPTLHVHLGEVRLNDEFDHTLYTQEDSPAGAWTDSVMTAGQVFRRGPVLGTGLVDPARGLRRFSLRGFRANRDTPFELA